MALQEFWPGMPDSTRLHNEKMNRIYELRAKFQTFLYEKVKDGYFFVNKDTTAIINLPDFHGAQIILTRPENGPLVLELASIGTNVDDEWKEIFSDAVRHAVMLKRGEMTMKEQE